MVGVELARAAVACQDGAGQTYAKGLRLDPQRIKGEGDLAAPVVARMVAIEGKGPERRVGLCRHAGRGVHRGVADPETAPRAGLGNSHIPRLVRARAILAPRGIRSVRIHGSWCLRILYIRVMPGGRRPD